MKKPAADDFEKFDREFKAASKRAGKQQFLVPYFIASHPGSALDAMIDLAVFLKRNRLSARPGAGFHSQPLRRRGLHVSHRARPVHQEAGLRRQAPARSQAAAGPDAVLQARELFRRAQASSKPAGRT